MKWLVLLALTACTSSSEVKFPQGTAYQGAGHEQFFLPELPSWANGSVGASCRRDFSVRYLDYQALGKVHGLDFRQRVELQSQFNLKWRERFANKPSLVLTPQEESVMFMEVLGQVKGGIKEFRFPAGATFQLVWWDSLKDKKDFKPWLRLLSDRGDAVVLVSVCADTDALETWVTKQKLDDLGVFVFGSETLNPMRADGKLVAGLVSPLEAYFPVVKSTLLKGKNNYPGEFITGYPVKTVED
jgi:hypothetical protein